MFIADTANHLIRKLSASVVSTVAGTAGTSGWSPDGQALQGTLLSSPSAIVMSPDGASVYWSETGTCIIRKLDLATSTVSTVAGAPRGCSCGVTGPAFASQFGAGGPLGLAFWGNDMIIADSGCHSIKQYRALSSTVSLLAGSATGSTSSSDGPYLAGGGFNSPRGLAIDPSGDIYVADYVSLEGNRAVPPSFSMVFHEFPLIPASIG